MLNSHWILCVSTAKESKKVYSCLRQSELIRTAAELLRKLILHEDGLSIAAIRLR
jgi:hypothetical protein